MIWDADFWIAPIISLSDEGRLAATESAGVFPGIRQGGPCL